MDIWKFYDITHAEHVICNPTNEEKLARLVELLRLTPDDSVVDIACGKGEFLIRLAEAYGARCLGVDISPYVVAAAERESEGARGGGERQSRSKSTVPTSNRTSHTASVSHRVSVPAGSSTDTPGLWTRLSVWSSLEAG